MLQRGDPVPHFEVRTVQGEPFSYSTIWQHRILVLVVLPAVESDAASEYVHRLTARFPEFARDAAECVVTRDPVPGLPAPGVVVADRWGEISHVLGGSEVADLPSPEELVEWVDYVQSQCPECEGEAK